MVKPLRLALVVMVVVVAVVPQLAAQAPAAPAALKSFTYEQVFGTPPGPPREDGPGEGGILGRLPSVTAWLDDARYLESRKDPADGERRLFAVSAADGSAAVYRDWPALTKKLPEGLDARRSAAATPDLGRLVFVKDDDLYLLDVGTGSFRRLTATPGEEENPTFSPDGMWLAYTRGNNLFAYDLTANLEHQLTGDGSETIKNGHASWVYMEEILGRGGAYQAFWWAPDSTRLVFLRFDDSPVPQFPLYRADGQHGELEMQRYPKAGDPNPYVQLGVVGVADAKLVWLDFEPKADHYLAFPEFTPDSKAVLVQWMNRGQDTIRIYSCDPGTGTKTQIHEERQGAWVSFYEDLRTLKDGSFLVRTDADGWEHIYLYAADGTLKKRLTAGAWRVTSIEGVDEQGGWVYFLGRPRKPWDTALMRVKLDGSGLQTLTPDAGVHRVRVSPDGGYFTDTFSTVSAPSRMTLLRGDGTLVRELGDTRTPAMAEYAWGKAELLTIPSGDGLDLPALWVLPTDFDPAKQYPVLMSIYGGPDAGTVYNAWQGLQAQYWAQRGVISFKVDHRGSGAFGKQAVALMHRCLGTWEMKDYTTAAAWLRSRPFVAKDRIGITGGSYGGYVTLMAMTAGAPAFNFGLAASSVGDWRLYDSVYTERYMDTPTENPDGYTQGAVLTHAEKYVGGLKITHGTMDDNVHMQNSIQVIDWLVSHNKSFDVMIYPNSRHGFQPAQRPHATREAHDFWVRTLLDGKAPLAPVLTGGAPGRRPQ
jgi:dipeptidyl-peptidase 4